jgi:hypothetical protein
MRLADHATLHFNNNMSTAPVFLVIEKLLAEHGISPLYQSSEFKFSTSLIKLIALSHCQQF